MDYDLAGRPLHLEMHTRRKGADAELICDLQVTAFTEAESIEEAAALMTRGREMAIMVSLATNCAIAPLEVELVYETTPGVTERDFFQRFVPEDQMSYADRSVPLDATASLLTAIAHSGERNRLIRAISQYSEALQLWENGSELLVLSHLFMGVEAIKKAAWRAEVTTRNISKESLAAEWGYDKNGRLGIDDFLDQMARVKLVFQGDSSTHKVAKKVSDSFEHGFANGGHLFAPAASAIVPTAKYLRAAIIGLAKPPPEYSSALLSDLYSSPRGPAGVDHYFYGKLRGPESAKLAAEGQDHPYCIWRIDVKARRKDDGSHEYEHKPTMTPRIGPDIQLVPLKHEAWGKGTFSPKSAATKDAKRGGLHRKEAEG